MAHKKRKSEKADKRNRARVWTGGFITGPNGTPVREYKAVSYTSKDDLEAQKLEVWEKFGVGVYERFRKTPLKPNVVIPPVGAAPVVTIDGDGKPNVTLGEFAWYWLGKYKTKLTKASKSDYTCTFNQQLIPAFGTRFMRSITMDELQTFVNSYAGWSESKVLKLMMILKNMFVAASLFNYVDDVIVAQITHLLTMPSTQVNERRPLTEAEERAVKAVYKIRNKEDYPPDSVQYHIAKNSEWLYLVALYNTGARPGEVYGIRWSDIDWKHFLIRIERDIDWNLDGSDKAGKLKRKSSYRYIPLFDELARELIQIRPPEDHLKPLASIGADYIFRGERSGAAISESTHKRRWKRLMIAVYEESVKTETDDPKELERNAIQHEIIETSEYKGREQSVLVPYNFRHNFATLLYWSGTDMMQAVEWMGHKNDRMIREVYAHLRGLDRARNATFFRAYLNKKESGDKAENV